MFRIQQNNHPRREPAKISGGEDLLSFSYVLYPLIHFHYFADFFDSRKRTFRRTALSVWFDICRAIIPTGSYFIKLSGRLARGREKVL
jgi:hypothetical protein